MPKYRVLDPNGFYDGKVKHEMDEEVHLSRGARLDAALHFQQVEPIKPKSQQENRQQQQQQQPPPGDGK